MATPTTLPAAFVSGDVLTAAQLNDLRGAFRVLQVVSTAKTDTFTTTSATFTGVTGLTVAITPSSATSKVLVIAQFSYGMANGAGYGYFKLSGGNSGNFVGDTAGTRVRSVFGGYAAVNLNELMMLGTIVYLDSPATTSATTYGVDVRTAFNGSVRINRAGLDSDDLLNGRGASSITALEISA
jgi:hypothetical protein